MSQTFFCDTNLFLQCQAIESLAWELVAGPAKQITVYIPRTVQNEIDRLKQDGNGRRSRRARDASSKMKELVRAETSSTSFSRKGLEIRIALAPRRPKSSPRLEDLDLGHGDDRIVDEALAWAHAHPTDNVAVLTNDVGMMSTAKHFGLPFTEIPEEWLLQPEPDERDKKIAVMEREAKILREQHPRIEASFSSTSGNKIERVAVAVTTYRALGKAEIDLLMDEIRARRPMARSFDVDEPCRPMNFPGAAYQRWHPPSEAAIRKYTEDEYPKWEAEVRDTLTKLAFYSEFPFRAVPLEIHLSNLGGKPAESMRVLVTAQNGLKILPSKTPQMPEGLPQAPEPPKGKWAGPLDHFAAIGSGISISPTSAKSLFSLPEIKTRDPRKVYRNKQPDDVYDRCEFSCGEFMHQVEGEVLSVEAFVPPKHPIHNAALELEVSASNLPSPLRMVLPVEVTYQEGDLMEIARAMAAKL